LGDAIIHRSEQQVIRPVQWRRTWHPAAAILLGLLTAQIIGTLQVYLSNRALHETLTLIKDAGYLPVPNSLTMGSLLEFSPAAVGGLFFALSVGAGASLISFGAAWTWDRIFLRKAFPLLCLLVLWAGSIAVLNWNGMSALPSAYFCFIPAVVFPFTLRWMPPRTSALVDASVLMHLLVIALLGSLWGPLLRGDLFLDLRDTLLLSNAPGSQVSDFYYRYTLYPAEAFKSLNQKMLKTCSLESSETISATEPLKRALLRNDYLPIKEGGPVDIELTGSGRELAFERRGRPVLETTRNDFLSGPEKVLERVSFRTDRYSLFRPFTFYGLLIGFPVALYILLYSLVSWPLSLLLHPRVASATASMICFLAGLTLLIPPTLNTRARIDNSAPDRLLGSDLWQERVAALKWVGRQGLDLSETPSYQKHVSSPHIPERYWLAKALAVSQSHETYEDLIRLLHDPSSLVTCAALQALGRRGDRQAVAEILQCFNNSNDWYVQWYAYRALRSLGWTQSESSP